MIGLSALNAEYIRDNAKEVVLDTRTGLVWQDDATPAQKIWTEALSYCETLTLASQNDWRLPNINELRYLTDKSRFNPSISPIFQNSVSSNYWSSTTYVAATTNAWNVYFDGGYDDALDKTNNFYVRCVR